MRKDEYEFVAVLQRELWTTTPKPISEVVELAMKLMRYGASLSRLAVYDCNVGHDARSLRKVENLHERVRKALAGTQISPRFNGDPRGATLKLALPSQICNSFGGEGYCVPRS